MTIHQTNSNVTYFGDGAQTVFNYNFRIFQAENLNIYVDGILQAYVSDYDVTNNGDETGGTVIFAAAPANGAVILIERVLSNQQLLDLIEYDRFPAESVEAALDYIVLLIQQNSAAAGRGLVASSLMPEGFDYEMPIPGAGEFWKYADDGLSVETTSINELGTQIIPTMTDSEIIAGVGTQTRLINASQVKLGVDTHQDPPVTSVFDSQLHEVVDVLPATPDASKIYLVRQ